MAKGDPLVLKQVWAVIDKRTTIICLHAAGQIRKVGEPFDTLNGPMQEPPFHVHCRSMSMPWMSGMVVKQRELANEELFNRPIEQRRFGPAGMPKNLPPRAVTSDVPAVKPVARVESEWSARLRAEGVPDDVVDDITKRFDELQDAFKLPDVTPPILDVGDAYAESLGLGGDPAMFAFSDSEGINLTSRWSSRDEIAKHLHNMNGMEIDSSPVGTITHEYGHVAAKQLRHRSEIMTPDDYATWQEIGDSFVRLQSDESLLHVGYPSVYGGTDLEEYLAELFSYGWSRYAGLAADSLSRDGLAMLMRNASHREFLDPFADNLIRLLRKYGPELHPLSWSPF